jgi:hypothetical protein
MQQNADHDEHTHRAGGESGELAHYPTVRQVLEVVARLSLDAGCLCLAQRLGLQEGGTAACGCCSPEASGQRPSVHVLAKLAPLTRLLADQGHYDLALLTVEAALSLEPTIDLDLARAYLFVVLGDMQDAQQIYARIIRRLGAIPRSELSRLMELARQHSSEDDIAELIGHLQSFAA